MTSKTSSMPKILSTSIYAIVDNLLVVQAALEANETYPEVDKVTLGMACCFFYQKKLNNFLNPSNRTPRTEDEEYLMSKLAASPSYADDVDKLRKYAAGSFAVGGLKSDFETSVILADKGAKLWGKWNRLKRTIMNEDVPLWNKLILKNSGLQIADMLLVYRKRKYYDLVRARLLLKLQKEGGEELPVENFAGSDDEEGAVPHRRGPLKKKDIENSTFLVGFDVDRYDSTYWIVKIYGPPAYPNHSRLFEAQLSSGPPKKSTEIPSAVPTTCLMMSAAGGPPDMTEPTKQNMTRTQWTKLQKEQKEERIERKRHNDMVKISLHGAAMDAYNLDIEIRKNKGLELERMIGVYQRTGNMVKLDEAVAKLEALSETPYPLKPALIDLTGSDGDDDETPTLSSRKRRRMANKQSKPPASIVRGLDLASPPAAVHESSVHVAEDSSDDGLDDFHDVIDDVMDEDEPDEEEVDTSSRPGTRQYAKRKTLGVAK
jgi:hypothetical protein